MAVSRKFVRWLLAAATVAIAVGVCKPALGVIKIDYPVSRVYKEAEVVAVAKLTRVDANGSFECKIEETLKGQLNEQALTINGGSELSKRLTVGQPVVVFISRQVAIIHVGDAWHQGNRQAGGRYAISGPYPMIKNYPGRTAGLAAIVREIKAGKKGIQDGIGHEFVGSLEDRGNLGVRPTFLVVVNPDGDGRSTGRGPGPAKDGQDDLLVGTADRVRLFRRIDGKYRDVAERCGLKEASGRLAAAGDLNGDGKTDLLIGRTLWLREGDRFVRSETTLALPADDTWAAVTITGADGDRLADVVVLTKVGRLATASNPGPKGGDWPVKSVDLWPGGETAQAAVFSRDWGDDGQGYVMVVHCDDIVRYPVGKAETPGSDFKRLTGITLSEYPKIGTTPLKVDLCAALDYDGNGRMDLLLVTRGGGVTLASRGFGAFIINAFMPTQFRTESPFKGGPKIPKLPFPIDSSVCVACCNRTGKGGKNNARNLLLLRADGQLFELVNARL